jgi:hypothetical protein
MCMQGGTSRNREYPCMYVCACVSVCMQREQDPLIGCMNIVVYPCMCVFMYAIIHTITIYTRTCLGSLHISYMGMHTVMGGIIFLSTTNTQTCMQSYLRAQYVHRQAQHHVCEHNVYTS